MLKHIQPRTNRNLIVLNNKQISMKPPKAMKGLRRNHPLIANHPQLIKLNIYKETSNKKII
jgi:hypothetical protein